MTAQTTPEPPQNPAPAPASAPRPASPSEAGSDVASEAVTKAASRPPSQPLSEPRPLSVLVLGANGKMGAMLARQWRASPPRGLEPSFAARRPDKDGAHLRLADLEAAMALGEAPRFDAVVALWGVTSGDAQALGANSALAQKAMEIGLAVGARRVLHASSSAVYAPAAAPLTEAAPTRPIGPYGLSKLDMERRVLERAGADPAEHGPADRDPPIGDRSDPADPAAPASRAPVPPGSVDAPRQCLVRFANLAGADSLFAALDRGAAITLDRFADGQGPIRSYIAPQDLARCLEALLGAPLAELPAVVNAAAGGGTSMEEIARAAGAEVLWRDAPEGAAQCVTLDLGKLAKFAPDLDTARSGAQIVAQVARDRALMGADAPADAAFFAAAAPAAPAATAPVSMAPATTADAENAAADTASDISAAAPARPAFRAPPPPHAAALGFRADRDPAKRAMDLVWAVILSVLLAPVIAVVALAILLLDGAPVFYVSERMRSPTRSFALWKFRTMRSDAADRGVSGGDKAHRITRSGAVLRRYRLDELPQLWNILRGDISFVGPRPPLRRYVEQFPSLYGQVLRAKPGVTGLATLAFHKREEALLAPCRDADETEAVYARRCIPAKARLDLMYRRNRSLCWDHWLILSTVLKRLPLRGPRL